MRNSNLARHPTHPSFCPGNYLFVARFTWTHNPTGYGKSPTSTAGARTWREGVNRTRHMTSSHMYFRALKPDMRAIVIFNHRLGKLDPRSEESPSWRGGGGWGTDRRGPQGQVVHNKLTFLGLQS